VRTHFMRMHLVYLPTEARRREVEAAVYFLLPSSLSSSSSLTPESTSQSGIAVIITSCATQAQDHTHLPVLTIKAIPARSGRR